MRYYEYVEPYGENDIRPKITVVSESQILTEYFEHWKQKMTNVDRKHLISPERCIEDFCVIHWAAFVGDL